MNRYNFPAISLPRRRNRLANRTRRGRACVLEIYSVAKYATFVPLDPLRALFLDEVNIRRRVVFIRQVQRRVEREKGYYGD